MLTFYGLGNILGAGIYVLVGKVAGAAGMCTPLAFLIALLLASFSAFSYAELSARYPLSAGESVYVHRGLRSRALALGVGLLIVLAGVLSAAAIVQGFVGYLQVLVAVPARPAVAASALALTAIAVWGIEPSARSAALVTLVEVFGLLLIVWVGRGALAELPARAPELVPAFEPEAWHGVLFGALLAFYAFIGFEDMVNVAEEVRRPTRALPAAILLALAVATLLYLVVALVAVMSLPPERLAQTDAPLALIYREATGRPPALISVVSMLAVINGALIQIIMSARILYGLAHQLWLPPVFARVHPVTRTPVLATVLSGGAVLILALAFAVERLAEHTSVVILMVFALVNLSLLRIKRRAPAPEGIRVFPYWVPVCGLVTSSGFVGFEVYNYLRWTP
ncbi:MAG: APC family permease [Gammaproteobacteria bacterium]|nr:APC family permease [Gammaproteobacteria bacterium]NIR98611.1 APC family permease [Gammaproteobacteria bacterium]NIT64334.1 APC family permease [Gammaproteobacteria bacterium]NIV21258.1 amino acid permease [Gammaproteobacteria bacterium]NIX10962.1 amino acid permease [Gammaproteobacteria bacterium]